MRKYNKIISLCLILTFMFAILPMNVFAAKGSYSASLSSSKINVGKSTSLNIKTSKAAGKFSVTSSNPNVAKVSTSATWVDGSSMDPSITIKGVSAGKATITITPVDVSDEDYNLLTSSKTLTIKVVEKATSNTNNSDKKDDSNKDDNKEETVKSKDATLKSITLKNGKIDFNKDKTDYTVNVGKDVTTLGLKAVANNSKATVKITGDENFKVGENIVKVTVTAEDGTTKVYTIKVIKSKVGTGPVLDLKVKGYEMLPEFDPAKLVYSVDVTGVTEVELEYKLADENSKAEVSGNKDLKLGKNEVKLVVTEPDETVTTYTVNVNLVENVTEKNNNTWLIIIIILAVLVVIEAVYIVVKNKNNK